MQRHTITAETREKLGLLAVVLVMLFLFGGLLKLQILEHEVLAERSENNRIRVQPLVPRRGVVYDREGRIIVDNRPSFTVSIVAAESVKGVSIPSLADALGLDTLQVRKRLQKNMVSRWQPAPIKRDIPFEVVAVIEEQGSRFPGVSIHMEEVRRYRPGLGSECFTGYVGEVSQDEMKSQGMSDYRLGSMIGKKGIEKYRDDILRGREGTAYIEVTASGQSLGPYREKEATPAVAGADLVLAIDNDLQRTCVSTLDTFCCGAIVAMDPRNGEILAMASYPGYDANIFSTVIPESLWQAITTDSTHPLLNRPLAGLYPPGSTTKLATVGAALQEGLVGENTTLKPCVGGYQFGNRFFRCWLPSGHGALNAVHAIEQSCDVYLYQLGVKLGVEDLSRYLGQCGFGRQTGVDLPSEMPGLNPNHAYYDERFGKGKWSRGVVLNLSIGQGEILSTPLQLAQFYCGLANNGTVYRPHLVRAISQPGGVRTDIVPEVAFKLPFSEKILALLNDGLRLVVEGEHGTARRLRNRLYSVGGKTGTAENPHGENHSWFVGVAPLENPEIVVCAILENAGHGSDVAAPTVGKVIETFMRKKLDLRLEVAGDTTGGEANAQVQ